MTVTANVRVVRAPRLYQGLPPGIQPFSVQGTVTGGAGAGDIIINFLFNPESDNTFLPYVAICYASWRGTVADPVLPPMLRAENAHWEKSSEATWGIVGMPLFINTESTEWISSINETYYLGRLQPSTTGQVQFKGDEINTTVYNAALSGFIADRPFMVDSTWKV